MSGSTHVVQTAGEQLLLAIDHYLTQHQAQVHGKPWRPATAEGKAPAPPQEWPYLALNAAADLLDLMRSAEPWNLGSLLRLVLENIRPIDALAEQAIRQIGRQLMGRWTMLLELDCPTVALLLREVAVRLRKEQSEGAKAVASDELSDVELDRKLAAENKGRHRRFAWPPDAECAYCIPTTQFLLLKALIWDDGDHVFYGRSVQTGAFPEQLDEAVIGKVWGKWDYATKVEKKRYRSRLYQLHLATNKTLEKNRLPLRITYPRHNHLRVEKN